jgi:hypothetical protein
MTRPRCRNIKKLCSRVSAQRVQDGRTLWTAAPFGPFCVVASPGRWTRGREEVLAIELEIEDGIIGFNPSWTYDASKPVTQFLSGWFYCFPGMKPKYWWAEYYHKSATVRTRELHSPDASQAYSSQMQHRRQGNAICYLAVVTLLLRLLFYRQKRYHVHLPIDILAFILSML